MISGAFSISEVIFSTFLLASGFIAGGALMGVVSAAMRFCGVNVMNEAWVANPLSEVASLVAYTLLIVYLVKASIKVK